MKCEHFPIVDTMDIPEATKSHYARITHESHPRHLVYRADIEARAAGRAFEREELCADPPTMVIGEATPQAALPTITRTRNAEPEPTNSYTDLLKLVEACEHRGEQIKGEAGCGCDRTWYCGMARGQFVTNPFEVNKSDCLRCVLDRAGTSSEERT